MTIELGLFAILIGGLISIGILLFSLVELTLCEFEIYPFSDEKSFWKNSLADDNENIWLMALAASVWS